jgi:hypothetical protein
LGNKVHGPSCGISRERHSTEDIADRTERALGRLVQERWNLGYMPRNQQEPSSGLRQAANLSAIVNSLRYGVPIAAKELHNLVQEGAASGGNARHVFKQNKFWRVIGKRFENQPHAAQGQPIERLISWCSAEGFGKQSRESLARRGHEDDVRVFVAGRASNVCGRRLSPTRWRICTVEGSVLLPIEKVEHCARHASKPFKVANGGWIRIDAADATKPCAAIANPNCAAIETTGASAESGEDMKMPDLDLFDQVCHGYLSFLVVRLR